LIEKTKQQRYDKKMARDEQEEATERLDEKWKEILQTGAMANYARPVKDKASSVIPPRPDTDDYDSLFFDLRMNSDKRGDASERQKTEEELAREEHEKLIRQEEARLTNERDNATERTRKKLKNGGKKGFVVKYDSSGALIDKEKVRQCSKIL
uniref:SNW domain-containing protein 1 n=1 Tax=Gongylonema pulchrum TaxID=637853 RepID=A0A183ESY2_9BILA